VTKRRRHADADEDEAVRRPVRAEIVEPAREEVRAQVSTAIVQGDESEESDVEMRRARIRARMAAEEQEELLPVMEDEEEEEEESGEDEVDEEESDEELFLPHRAAAIRPHFVKR